jgi:Asp-tRNA(Asn)/Glu-tRNA(Gln) amidotransferase A subunit family amidase
VGAKDEFHVAGMPNLMADATGRLQTEDATAVARLRAAGAIVLGKTHMPLDGRMPPTRNPWNLEHTPGGTSSGSGAGVGARMVPLALGEQTYGSNLRPAAYCGVAGLKPSYGRVSRFGCYPFTWSLDHVGLIGLTMADIALVLSVIAGPDPRDPASLPEPAPVADLNLAGVTPPRIGIVRNFYPERTEPVMLEAIEASADKLRAAGAAICDINLPEDFELLWLIQPVIGSPEAYTFHSRRRAEPGGPPTPARDRVASLLPASYYLQAQRIRRMLWEKLSALYAGVDALLMAVAPGAAPSGLESSGDPSLLVPWSDVGFPAITLSAGLSPDGLPLGLQFVGAPSADYQLLQTGAWCERVLGRLPAPPLLG